MKLLTNEIAYLKQIYPNSSPLSLLNNIEGTINGTESISLLEKGVLVSDMEIASQSKMPIDVLAYPEACCRLILSNPFCTIEKYVYRKGNERLLVENDNGDFNLSMITAEQEILFEMAQWTGATQIKTAAFDVDLNYDELLVFSGLLDYHRSNVLRGYLGETSLKDGISMIMLQKSIETPRTGSITQALVKNYGLKAPNNQVFENAVSKMMKIGVIQTGDSLGLAGSYRIFANYFLVPEAVIMMEAMALQDDESISAASSLIFGSGLHSWLMLAFGETNVQTSSVTSGEILEIMRFHLQCGN